MPLHPRRLRYYYVFLGVYFIFQVVFLIILRSLNEDSHTNAFRILQIYKQSVIKLNKNARFDNSGLYKIIQLKQLNNNPTVDISVVSQCSANHFDSVDRLFKAWEGPISVSIFSEVEDIERTLWDVAKFLHCYNWRDFGMHLVVPSQDVYVKDYKFPQGLLSKSDKSVTCNSHYISSEKERKNYNWTSLYPVNLLRNLAKMGTSTEFILVIDIDMIPSSNLRNDFLDFIKLEKSDQKVVYVVPIFETLSDVPPPSDKTELISAINSNQARPFYIVPCENCQKLTRYEDWLASGNPQIGTRILHQVEWKHPWEPFFIARKDVPNFDERFRQYGMNRVSQICELYVAGFRFLVMDNLFLIHRGYKRSDDFHETKNKEMDSNRRLYVRFKTEVRYKYPESDRRC